MGTDAMRRNVVLRSAWTICVVQHRCGETPHPPQPPLHHNQTARHTGNATTYLIEGGAHRWRAVPALPNEAHPLVRRVTFPVSERRPRALHDAHLQRRRLVRQVGERHTASEQLPQAHAKRVGVAELGVDVFTTQDLRRDPQQRAAHSGVATGAVRRHGGLRVPPCHAEVRHLHVEVGGDQQVRRLEVAMGEAPVMQVVHAQRRVHRHATTQFPAQPRRRAVENVPQAAPADELGDNGELAGGAAGAHEERYVGVPQQRQRLHLGEERLAVAAALFVGPRRRREHYFQSHVLQGHIQRRQSGPAKK